MTKGNEQTAPRCGVEKDVLKQDIYAYCIGQYNEMKDASNKVVCDENAIIPELLSVWNAFKQYDFELDDFMSKKGYEVIDDEDLRVEVLMEVCFPILNRPIARFMIDWSNGYLDFFKRETEGITDAEILHQLFFCTTEEDIWKLMAQGIGDVEGLYHWYKGDNLNPILEAATGIPCYCEKDEQKASDFLEYLLSNSSETTESVRNKAMNLKKMAENTHKIREIVVDLKE